MKTEKPILSCAGREAVSIDSALLTELLLSFTPNTIDIRNKAGNVANALYDVASGEFGDNALDEFKNIVTTEFLSLQLMEAVQLARQIPARTAYTIPDEGDIV